MSKLFLVMLLMCATQAMAQEDTLNRTDNRGQKSGYWISRDPAGRKVYEGFFRDGRPTGKFRRYHENGQIRAEMNYHPDGIRVEARLFDTGGRLRAEGLYKNQLRDSLWSYYSERNLPMFRIDYADGKIHGKALRYDLNGILVEQTQWKSDRVDGVQIIFYPDGQAQARIEYRDGKMDGSYVLLFPDGRVEVKGQYKAGLRSGDWTYYLKSGDADFVLSYQNGVLMNPDTLDARQKATFEQYEKNRALLRDPQDFRNNPEGLMGR